MTRCVMVTVFFFFFWLALKLSILYLEGTSEINKYFSSIDEKTEAKNEQSIKDYAKAQKLLF